MPDDVVAYRRRKWTGFLVILEVIMLVVVCGKMYYEYRHGAGLDVLLVGIPMLGVLFGLWIVHNQFVRKLGELVTDPVAFDQLSLIADRLEMLVLISVFFAMGMAKWLLHGSLL